MNKLVIDLEMADKAVVNNIRIHEIIEIGAVLLDESNNILGTYQSYVRNEHGRISKTITDLTGIDETKTAAAPKLIDVFKDIENKFCKLDTSETILYTWSENDTAEITKEMQAKRLRHPGVEQMCAKYIDIQQIFSERIHLQKAMNLTKALNLIGIEFDGKEHGALDDAINTAKMLQLLEGEDLQELIDKIHKLLEGEPMVNTMGSLFDFSTLKLE